jgi:hypothetical protein
MLWFPEFFGSFLPGWAFNVATIVHSDEALLATGFIFTVHFFNTHGRPEKFPMDFVIFNGQMSKEEFIEERGDQWKRYEEQGTTEQFAARQPDTRGAPSGAPFVCAPTWNRHSSPAVPRFLAIMSTLHPSPFSPCQVPRPANWSHIIR